MNNAIKQTIAEEATNQAQNWAMWLFAGLGISIAVNEFLGGLLLSCACASVMARTRKDDRKKWLMIATAAVLSILVAIVWPALHTEIPVQFGMALSGFMSRWIVNIFAKFLDQAEERAADVADVVIDKVADKKDE